MTETLAFGIALLQKWGENCTILTSFEKLVNMSNKDAFLPPLACFTSGSWVHTSGITTQRYARNLSLWGRLVRPAVEEPPSRQPPWSLSLFIFLFATDNSPEAVSVTVLGFDTVTAYYTACTVSSTIVLAVSSSSIPCLNQD